MIYYNVINIKHFTDTLNANVLRFDRKKCGHLF